VQPFLPPRKLPKPLAQLQQYWNGLRRGENAVPFSDDVNPSALTGLSDNLILVDVFDRPQRFRFSTVGREIAAKLSMEITGTFADDVETRCPLEFFLAQASATAEAANPTFYRRNPKGAKRTHRSTYSLLLLPTWGKGRVDMLIGAIVWT
jgi:hypothetical protein